MAVEVSEVSLKAFIESVFFKGLARGAMIFVAAAAGYIGAVLTAVNTRTGALETTVTRIQEVQAVQAQDSRSFQAFTVRSFSDLDGELAAARSDISAVNAKLGEISGTLQEMQRQNVARVLRYREGGAL